MPNNDLVEMRSISLLFFCFRIPNTQNSWQYVKRAVPNDVKFENQNGNSRAALPEWSFFMASTAVNAQQAEHIIVCSHWATPFFFVHLQ
jgi:hypothetical protein